MDLPRGSWYHKNRGHLNIPDPLTVTDKKEDATMANLTTAEYKKASDIVIALMFFATFWGFFSCVGTAGFMIYLGSAFSWTLALYGAGVGLGAAIITYELGK